MESMDLFVGIPITPEIQESLDTASLPFRRYFEGGKFLQVAAIDGQDWLGKAIPRSASTDRLDDMRRHVQSVILKIDPGTEIPIDGIEVRDLPLPLPCDPEDEFEAAAEEP